MKFMHVLAGIAAFAAVAAAGVSAASNLTSSQGSDFYAPGKHQFYVWCAGGHDHVAYQSGASAEDAQMRLYRSAPGQKCWPIWQGRIPTPN